VHEESRRLEVDVAAIRATVERLAVEQEHLRAEVLELRREVRGDIRGLQSQLSHTQLAVFATLATTLGILVANLVA
jgi:hypothetical protein